MISPFSHRPAGFAASEMPLEEMLKCHHDQLRKVSDVEVFAYFIWSETRGEKVEGMLAVAHVVLNRVKVRSYYGKTIRDVILKHGHFTCFKEKDPILAQILRLSTGDKEFALCKVIAELAIREHLKNDPTGGATHFHKADSNPPWAAQLTYLRQIGNYVFYRESLNRSKEDHGLVVEKRGLGREL